MFSLSPQDMYAINDSTKKSLKKHMDHDLTPTSFLITNAERLAKVPGILEGFLKGAGSYPVTWWAANIQLLCLSGIFGEHNKNAAKIRQAIFDSLMRSAIKYPLSTAKLVYYYEKGRVEYNAAQVAGRLVGGYITNNYLLGFSKIKILKKSAGLRLLTTTAQFLYVSFGAAIMAIAIGIRSIEGALWAILSGDYLFKERDILKKTTNIHNLTEEDVKKYYDQMLPTLKKMLRMKNESVW